MYPNNMQFLLESFKDSMDKPYGYALLDLTQTTPSSLRVQTGICPRNERIIYQEKKDIFKFNIFINKIN